MGKKQQVAHRQIFDKTSLTNELVSITCNLKDDPSDLTELIALVRLQIMRDCAYYEPSVLDVMLCTSGELDGSMFVPEGCNHCIVGQFSLSGHFTGEIQPDKQLSSEDNSNF